MSYNGEEISSAEWQAAEDRDFEENMSSFNYNENAPCDECGGSGCYEDDRCPECCENDFSAADIECDFCEYRDECMENSL